MAQKRCYFVCRRRDRRQRSWNLYGKRGTPAALLNVHWPRVLPSRFEEFETVELALLLVLMSAGIKMTIPGFADLNRSDFEQEILRR